MKFFSRELCQKLQEMGCVSFYYKTRDGAIVPSWQENALSLFTAYDFIAPNEVARENAKKVFGQDPIRTGLAKLVKTIYGPDVMAAFEYHCHAIIDLPNEEAVEKYLWMTLQIVY